MLPLTNKASAPVEAITNTSVERIRDVILTLPYRIAFAVTENRSFGSVSFEAKELVGGNHRRCSFVAASRNRFFVSCWLTHGGDELASQPARLTPSCCLLPIQGVCTVPAVPGRRELGINGAIPSRPGEAVVKVVIR